MSVVKPAFSGSLIVKSAVTTSLSVLYPRVITYSVQVLSMVNVAVFPSTTLLSVLSLSRNSSTLLAVVEYHTVTALSSSVVTVTSTGALYVPPSGDTTGVFSGSLATTVTFIVAVSGLNSLFPANVAVMVTVLVSVTYDEARLPYSSTEHTLQSDDLYVMGDSLLGLSRSA